MTVCVWCVLCLPAFVIPTLAVLGPAVPCVDRRFDTCEGRHMERVRVAVDEGFGLPLFDKMCASIKMTASVWCVLCLPAFVIPTLAVLGPAVPCVDRRSDTCEGRHTERVRVAVDEGFGLPLFDKMCASIKELLTCAAKECEGQSWDSDHDFVTKQLKFSEAAGLCGKEALTNPCSTNIAKRCWRKMARSIAKTGDYCDYYLAYAKCATTDLPACGDPIATYFADDMSQQVSAKLGIIVGSKMPRMCGAW